MAQTSGDAELADAWRRGDREAGAVLVRRHFDAVFHFFASKVGDTAADLAQRTFLACAEGLASFRGDSSFKAFLFGIARMQLLRYFDQRRRETREDAPGPVPLASPSMVAVAAEEDQRVLAALRQLPLDLQITIELHYWERMALAEIAIVFDVAENTVKTRLFRARRMLREAIDTAMPIEAAMRTTVDTLDRWAASMRRRASE